MNKGLRPQRPLEVNQPLALPLGAETELVEEAICKQRTVLIDKEVLTAIDADQEANDV